MLEDLEKPDDLHCGLEVEVFGLRRGRKFHLHWGFVVQSILAPLGDREFRNLALMAIFKLNSAGDMYFKVLALLRI